MKIPKGRFDEVKSIISSWENSTKFNMEGTQYSAVYSRDVNNYIAIKTDGKVKTKGIFTPGGLQKSPTNDVCAKAFIHHILTGESIEDFILKHKDFRDFLSIKQVNGGAVKDGVYLGKVVRWYYSTSVSGTINYKKNGNIVQRSTGGKPCMTLPDEFPSDINYRWYIKEANKFLWNVGIKPEPIPTKIPRKNTKLWKEMFARGEIVEFEGKFIHVNDVD
jgi:hypothetical protein